jgi:hypothetical protein
MIRTRESTKRDTESSGQAVVRAARVDAQAALDLQRSAGNAAVARLAGTLARQPVVVEDKAPPVLAGVAGSDVALRSSPVGPRPHNRFHNLVATLQSDAHLVVEGHEGKWMRVRVESGTALDRLTNRPTNAAGLTGYVSAELLTRRDPPRPTTVDPADYRSLEAFSEAWPDRVTSTERLEQLWLGQSRAVWTKKALAAAGIDPKQWVPRAGFKHNEQTFLKVYRYYESLYLADNRLKWAAMAKLAGGEVYRGYRDQILPNIKFGAFLRSGDQSKYTVLDLVGDAYQVYASTLDIRLLEMQKAIFMDLAWQHEAYREGGISALAAARARGELDDGVLKAWKDIDSGEPAKVNAGNKELLRREQFEILQGGRGGPNFYKLIQDIPDNDMIPEAMSEEARSPIPGGKPFAAVVDDGDITKFEDRWAWIEKDMFPAFERLDAATLRALVQKPLADLASR